MTLRYCQSFDYLTTAQLDLEGNNTQATIAATGRNSGSCLDTSTVSRGWQWTGDGGAARQTVYIGCAFKWLSGAFATDVFQLRDSANIIHVALQVTSTQKLQVTRNGGGSGTVIAGPGSTTLTSDVWYYLELKAVIDDTAGAIEVRVNGVSELTGSSLDTRNAGAAASVNHFRLGFGSATPNVANHRWDDLYFLDDQGSTNNGFLGDVRVQALLPNGNGNTSNLVGSDSNSTDNYLLVDDATANGDTDYVESSSVGDKDTYAMGNLGSTSGTVCAVRPIVIARKSDAGLRSVCSIARLSGTEVDSSNATLSTDYQNLWDIRETKPGGGAWTVSDVNGAEFGMKVTV